jgi:hypothetical protein
MGEAAMHRIFFLLLAGPFWLQFVFAGGLVYFGYTSQQSAQLKYVQRAELLQSTPPTTIAIGDFAAKYDHKAPREVSVTAQIALDHNTRLIRKTNFITTGEDILYVLVDPDAPEGETVVRGAIVLDPDQKDRFADWAMENMVTYGGSGPVVTVNGLLDAGTQTSMVSDAFKEQGMAKGPNFFYIMPFLEGRAAGLAQKPNEAVNHAMPFYYAALFFALLGLAKLVYRRNTPVKTAPVVLSSDLRSTIGHGTPILRPETPDLVSRFMSDHATLARAEAAFANPKIAVAEMGQTKLAPTASAEVFSVPAPEYATRAGSSAIETTPSLVERLRSAATSTRAPQIIAYAGLAILLFAIAGMMRAGSGSFGQMQSVDETTALAKSALPWIGGLILALLAFKTLAGRNGTSKRKEIYDPYLRMAERERSLNDRN